MATLSPVRLLIADRSENRAHEIDSVLRNAGIPTRAEFCADLSEISDPEQPIDLLLCRSHFDHLEQVLPALRKLKPNLPIIVMDDSPEPKNLTRGLAMGATDVIINNDNERLLHVVKREIENVNQRDRFSQTQRALQDAERRCELLLANSTAAIAYVHEGMHIYANDDYFKLFGFADVDELLGLPLLDLMDASFADEFRAKIKTFRDDSSDELSFSFCGRTTEGIPIAGQMTLTGAVYEGEHCTQVLVRSQAVPVLRMRLPTLEEVELTRAGRDTGRDASSPRTATARIRLRSVIRSLRTSNRAPRDRARCSRSRSTISTRCRSRSACIAPRTWSAQIADALTAELGGSRMARIANHRFAVATVGASEAGGDVLAERLRETIEGGLFEVDGKTVRRTITIGAAVLGDSGSVGDAMNLAFRTLVSSRRSGKTNCIAWPTVTVIEAEGNATGLTSEQRRILKLVNDAIENQTFVLLFQPIISLRGDSDEHYEVFLRLLDEKSRRLPPDQFLQLAIDNGVAAKIDRWVILQSIKTLSQHRSKGHNTRLTINLTRNSLIDDEFIAWLGVAIKAARLPSDAVIFQIAEPDAATYVRQARDFVQGLKAIHCRTSLRHFGTTDNPFETLRHVPVDFVKLDGNHVQKLDGDQARKEKLTDHDSESSSSTAS